MYNTYRMNTGQHIDEKKRSKGRTERASLHTVLLARFSALGDVALTIPVVYSVCRAYPGVNFVFLTRHPFHKLFVNPPANLTVVPCDLKDAFAGVGGMRRLAQTVYTRFKPDVFVDLHNVIRTRLLSLFLRLKGIHTYRLHKPRAQRRAMTRQRNKQMATLTPQFMRYADVFNKAGLPVELSFDGLFAQQCPTAPLFTKGDGEKWVGIAPFAAHESKIYPPELMEQVVATLRKTKNLRIFLFGGGQKEADVLDGWARKYPGCTSLASLKAGFPAELQLMSQLDVMVAMDSGNMHMAAIAGAPVISIWGATHPDLGFRPWNMDPDLAIQLPLACRPCSVFGNRPCQIGTLECLRAITPKQIVEKINSRLYPENQD